MKKILLSSAVLLGTAMIWGFAFVGQILGAAYLDAFSFNAARFFLGVVSLIPVILIFERDHPDRKKKRKTVIGSLITGTILFGASALQQYGTGLVGNPGKSGFITGLYTVLTPLLYFLFFRRKTRATTWLGAVLAMVGLYFLCVGGADRFTFGMAEFLLFLGAILWAVHIIAIDHFIEDVSPLKYSCGQFIVCGSLNLICAFLFGNPTFEGLQQGFWAIFYCGVLSVGVAYTGQVIGLKMADNPTRGAILLSTESLFSAIGGILWNLIPGVKKVDSAPSLFGVIGGALIFLAILLEQLPEKEKETPPEEHATE